jgi:endogenous inhibitor of DNA gyrase (YacG/DUF329 family)
MSNLSVTKPKQVSCPNCKKLTEYSTSNPYRPFCSERCKLIDLGDWANENYKIPVAPTLDDLETLDEHIKPN